MYLGKFPSCGSTNRINWLTEWSIPIAREVSLETVQSLEKTVSTENEYYLTTFEIKERKHLNKETNLPPVCFSFMIISSEGLCFNNSPAV